MAAASATAGSTKMLHISLDSFAKMADLSWISTLCEDPEGKKHVPNDKMRPVRSGHYVLTEPKVICIKKKSYCALQFVPSGMIYQHFHFEKSIAHHIISPIVKASSRCKACHL